jgi:hypothetical protein
MLGAVELDDEEISIGSSVAMREEVRIPSSLRLLSEFSAKARFDDAEH